jgi:AraC-like DNA-binding protein
MARIVTSYCCYTERTTGFTTRRELPHGEGVLIINLGEDSFVTGGDRRELTLRPGMGFVAGPHLRPALSRSTGNQTGIQIRLPLDGLRRLIDAPMTEIMNQVVPLDVFFGAEGRALGRTLCEASTSEAQVQILDSALEHRLESTGKLDRRQLGALELLRDRPDLDIADVARHVGWSRKHLANRIRDAVGVGPRTFRRLLRFQQLIQLAGGISKPDWATVALDAGYYDQSHLIRDFRDFADMSPTEFAARSLPSGGGLVES